MNVTMPPEAKSLEVSLDLNDDVRSPGSPARRALSRTTSDGLKQTISHNRILSPMNELNRRHAREATEREVSMRQKALDSRLSQSVKDRHSVVNVVNAQVRTIQQMTAFSHGHGAGVHGGHGSKGQSIVTAVASGAINFLLMFGLCCAYGMIMFEDSHNAVHRNLGVKINLFTAWFMGTIVCVLSKVPVAVGGPDLNPVVFIGGFVKIISAAIADDLGLEYPAARRLELRDWASWGSSLLSAPSSANVAFAESVDNHWSRRLGGVESNFCMDSHRRLGPSASAGGGYGTYPADLCAQYHEELAATVIFTTAFSTFMLGCVFIALGKAKLAQFVAFVPTSVQEAFLSCVGFKVFKYALKFCAKEPRQFVPAAMVGVPLYFMKAYHVGNAAVVIPGMVLIPLALFYVIIYGTGSDIDEARADDLFFPVIENMPFYEIYTKAWMKPGNINFGAWLQTLPNLATMLVVVVIDSLLKIASTESKVPDTKCDKEHEITLYGMANLPTALCGGSVGYMQLKFNVINFGILGNTLDRRGAFIYATLCGVCFFGTIYPFNYLPRFFLGILLFFAGAGFVCENLWGSRKYLSRHEWSEILGILAVFIITEQLLPAVIVGGLITAIDFIVRYAKVPCIVGRPVRGSQIISHNRRDPHIQKAIGHVANHCVLVLRLKGYLFFASVQSVTNVMTQRLEVEKLSAMPDYQRLRFVIFDCKLIDGMDASALKEFRRIVKDASKAGVRLLFTNLDTSFAEILKFNEILQTDEDWFESLDEAMSQIETAIMSRLEALREKVLTLHPHFALMDFYGKSAWNFEPFRDIFFLQGGRQGCLWRYCTKVPMHSFNTILWEPGDMDAGVYLVHSGVVALFKDLPVQSSVTSVDLDLPTTSMHSTAQFDVPDTCKEAIEAIHVDVPHALYTQGWFLNPDALCDEPAKFTAVAVSDGEALHWSMAQWARMSHECPAMANAFQAAILRQRRVDAEQADMELHIAQEALYLEGEDLYADSSPSPAATAVTERKLAEVTVLNAKFSTAEAFASLGLYTAVGEHEQAYFPALPPLLAESVLVAFNTFATAPTKENGAAEKLLLWAKVDMALMYAGIFDVPLAKEGPALNKESFMELARRASFVPLTQALRAHFRTTYDEVVQAPTNQRKHYGRKIHKVYYGEVADVFEDAFGVRLRLNDLTDVVEEWDHAMPQLDGELVAALMARLAKMHEPYWVFLQGLQEVTGCTPGSGERPDLTAERITSLFEQNNTELGNLSVREILWMSDWRKKGRGDGKALDFLGLAALICLHTAKVTCPLPPYPARVKSAEVAHLYEACLRPSRAAPSPAAASSAQEEATTPKSARSRDETWPSEMPPRGSPCGRGGRFPSKQEVTKVFNEGHSPRSGKHCGLEKSADAEVAQVQVHVQENLKLAWSTKESMKLSAGNGHRVNGSSGFVYPSAEVDVDSLFADPLAKGRTLLEMGKFDFSHRETVKIGAISGPMDECRVTRDLAALEVELPPKMGCRLAIFTFMEFPESSPLANVYAVFMGMLIIFSVLTMVAESLISPPYEAPHPEVEIKTWEILETVFSITFTIEICIRFAVADADGKGSQMQFLQEPSNICDIAAVLPWYIEMIFMTVASEFRLLRTVRLVRVIRILRLARMGRVAKLVKISSLFGPIAACLVLVWGIYIKLTLSMDAPEE
eukprot:TRINITY_DN3259_c0_g1_i3.p1 TRINITY_DN3259_c0_g1~~TRINITY_DN3259_c0_g1_i3.p1  ORF type:complete len:1673 (+),score=413.05 TRINITY_DN3259_c0_g1_i3:114-5132(+)